MRNGPAVEAYLSQCGAVVTIVSHVLRLQVVKMASKYGGQLQLSVYEIRSHRQLTGAGSSGEVWARCNNSWLQELLVTKYDKDRLGGITQVDHILIDIREHSNILLQSVTEVDMINGHYSVVVKKLG